MSGIGVMSPFEGAALKYQIGGILNDVQRLADAAGESNDRPVIELLSALTEAHAAAARIEDRGTDTPKGVSPSRK